MLNLFLLINLKGNLSWQEHEAQHEAAQREVVPQDPVEKRLAEKLLDVKKQQQRRVAQKLVQRESLQRLVVAPEKRRVARQPVENLQCNLELGSVMSPISYSIYYHQR